MNGEKKEYCGCADAYGLQVIGVKNPENVESYMDYADMMRGRGAVYFDAFLTDEEIKAVNDLVEAKDIENALHELKKSENVVPEPNQEMIWFRLPDATLDGNQYGNYR